MLFQPRNVPWYLWPVAAPVAAALVVFVLADGAVRRVVRAFR